MSRGQTLEGLRPKRCQAPYKPQSSGLTPRHEEPKRFCIKQTPSLEANLKPHVPRPSPSWDNRRSQRKPQRRDARLETTLGCVELYLRGGQPFPNFNLRDWGGAGEPFSHVIGEIPLLSDLNTGSVTDFDPSLLTGSSLVEGSSEGCRDGEEQDGVVVGLLL